jgi:hypothetical protein
MLSGVWYQLLQGVSQSNVQNKSSSNPSIIKGIMSREHDGAFDKVTPLVA